MGINLIGRVSGSLFSNNTKVEVEPRDPNPNNYTILKSEKIGDYLILTVRYHGCTNYEGKKILLFKHCTLFQIKKQRVIDPHFSNNKKYKSPIARFEPTKRGEAMARKLCY